MFYFYGTLVNTAEVLRSQLETAIFSHNQKLSAALHSDPTLQNNETQ